MDSSDSLKIDENLARFLAAYDQGLDGGEGGDAPTIQVPFPSLNSPMAATERPVTPMNPDSLNEGSLGDLLPDRERPAWTPPAPVSVPVGGPHRIGRFELRRQLGKGGCGIVFLAYDPKLRREVALKIPRPEMLMNPDAKRRLKLEALAASEFDHPNLVPVYEWGEIGPLCFVTTAFCPGQTLAGWLDRQAFPVPVRQAARLIATIADAVQHAHDRGVLHRDLKPNNIILQEMKVEENDEPPAGSVPMRGGHYVPRVVDFGLAKLAERGGPSETGTRQILGTPKYMSPEQAQARREDIGPPADVYALGVVLYELITGRAPYDGASDVEVLRLSVEGKPTPPHDLRPDVPRDLEAICLKAMARATSERYRTAIDLADDLRRFLDERPTVARPLAWSGRAIRWLRRNDQIVAIAVLATIALTVTLLGTWNSYRNSYQSRQLRTELRTVVRDQADRNRADQQREYVRATREAFHAWRGGNTKAASEALDSARRTSDTITEPTDFAHGYLARLVKARRLMIVCPAGPVTALAVSPDGTRLASGHADGTLTVWDIATGKPLGSVQAHDGEVSRVAFALGGSLLVTCGKANDPAPGVYGWSVAKNGTLALAPAEHRELAKDCSCFAVAPDGKTVYAGGRGGLLMKRTLSDPAPMITRPIAPGQVAITAMAATPDGTRVITADARGTVLRWTAALKRDDLRDYEFGEEVSALTATDAGLPAVGFGSGTVWITAPVCHPLIFPVGGRVRWIATAPDGSFALSAQPGRVRLSSGHDLPIGDRGDVRAGVYSPDGKTLFTAGADGIIRSWNFPADARERGVASTGRVTAIGVRPGVGRAGSGEYIVADTAGVTEFEKGTGASKVVETGTLKLRVIQLLEDGTRRGVAFDGRAVVVCTVAGVVEERFRVKLPDNRTPTSAALTPDGAFLAVGDDAGRVGVWSVADKSSVATIDLGHRRPVRDVSLSEDGKVVAARTTTGLGVWAVSTSNALAAIAADDQDTFRLLPGERIAVAGRDGVVRVWTVTGREEMSFFGHVGRVTGLGVSPDGRTLVSGCATGEVKFWDLRSGQELFGLRRHTKPVTVIEFATDGKLMITGGDGQLAVWDARE